MRVLQILNNLQISGSRIDIPADKFIRPQIDGFTRLKGPSLCFLISHPSGRKVLFDLSIRRDYKNLAPTVVNTIQNLGPDWHISSPSDFSEVLSKNGIQLQDVTAIIWSHYHFDHVGNPASFPESTKLVVGPGFKAEAGNGYPGKADSPVLSKDWEGRELVELDFESPTNVLRIGRFDAIDWFGDGSFYVLNTPGHAVGHVCGLARVQENSFVLMAGVNKPSSFPYTITTLTGCFWDCAHHPGEFRPSVHVPILPSLTGYQPEQLVRVGGTTPLFQPAEDFTHNYQQCLWTLRGIEEFDANDNIFVLLAHDTHALSALEEKDGLGRSWVFPEKPIDSWETDRLKQYVHWIFLADFRASVPENLKLDDEPEK
jgi:hypothetical protein